MFTKRIYKKHKITFIFALIILFTVSGFCMGAANAYSTEFQMVREEQLTVTDAGRFVNEYDRVRLPENIDTIKAKGYNYIRIYIESIISEKDDGYQSIMFYPSSSKSATMLIEFKFEHSPQKADSTTRNIFNEVTIFLDNFDYDEFVIRYGASGKGADTYYIKKVKVKFLYTNTVDAPVTKIINPNKRTII